MEVDGGTRVLRRVSIAAAIVVGTSALVIVSCGPPPIGWQGAGRLQTLPTPEGTVDGGSSTATADTGAEMGMDADQEIDSGADSGAEAGSDGGDGSLKDAGKDSGSGSKPKDAGADAVDGAHPGNPGQFDGGPDAPLG